MGTTRWVTAATRAEKRTIYAAGLVQGITLVTFPAASTIFTSAAWYSLSASQYGLMFVPQVIAAIAASLGGARLAGRLGWKRVYLGGLAANLASMGLLVISRFTAHDQAVAFMLLLAATAFLGLGFGLTVPAVNTFTADFHPGAVDGSVLVLNALLGLGTALAPVFVAIFTGLGAWVGLPILAAALLVALLAVSLRLPLRPGTAGPASTSHAGIPPLFWVFAAFAAAYGFCETMNGNWSQLDLTSLHVSATTASLTLTAFWAMVTAGRVAFAAVQRWVPSRVAYHVLPFVLAGAFVFIALLPSGAAGAGVVAFGLAGLGCSALLPLTISFGQERLVTMSSSAAGGVIACYQFGYGIAAFGVGPLRSAGLTLPEIYGASAVVSVVLGVLSAAIARGSPSPAALHPRPTSHLR